MKWVISSIIVLFVAVLLSWHYIQNSNQQMRESYIITFSSIEKMEQFQRDYLTVGKDKKALYSLKMVTGLFTLNEVQFLQKKGFQLEKDQNVYPHAQIMFGHEADEEIGNYIFNLKINKLWEQGYRGKGVRIGVIDTGVDTNHPDLFITGGTSVVETTRIPTYEDSTGHGTHVTGIIAATDNTIGSIGIAPEASVYSIRIFDDNGGAKVSSLIEGIEWGIQHNIDILNISLGVENDVDSLEKAINQAYEKGVLIVAAVGNDKKKSINFPARYSSVVAIGSVGATNMLSVFSNKGEQMDFVTFGERIYSTYKNGRYIEMSGTSMATPIVTGVLALVKEAYPTYSNEQLITLLKKKTIDLGRTGYDTAYGHGMMQPYRLFIEEPPIYFPLLQGRFPMIRYTSTSLNFRIAPSFKSNIMVILKPGTRVIVYNVRNGWAKVKAGKREGYVYAFYLKK